MDKEIKCSLNKHSDVKAIAFCMECNKFMCNKCRQLHSDLFDDNQLSNIEKNDNNTNFFTGICKEENHSLKLEYFCNTHKKLCCERCVSKYKNKGNGQHAYCSISLLEQIEKLNKDKLDKNIKSLENLNKNINKKIDELKIMIEKTDKQKEELIVKIQKIFTQIRSAINEREDQLLLYVGKKFDRYCIKKDKIKEIEDLPKLIKSNIEKGNILKNDWKKKSLSFLINDCTKIEENLNKINIINNRLTKINSANIHINFFPNDYEVNHLVTSLKEFGKISAKEYKYSFRECPNDIEDNKKYIVSGIDNNILTKFGNNCWTGIMCKNPLEKNKRHIWKIKILESHKNSNSIIIGVAPENFDINKSTYTNCGWYLCCCCGHLFSGAPHNYKDKVIDDKFTLKSKVITFIMNMKKGCLRYTYDDKEISKEIYTNIPVDQNLYLVVFLKYKDDKVIISDNNWRPINFKKIEKEREKKDKNESGIKEEKKEERNEFIPPNRGRGFQRGRGFGVNPILRGPRRGFGKLPGFRGKIGGRGGRGGRGSK